MVIATVIIMKSMMIKIYDNDNSDNNYQIMNARITLHVGGDNF